MRATEAIAHVALDGRTHRLDEHLRAVADRAAHYASAFDGAECAALAGLWHDLGKYAADFQAKLAAAGAADAHVETERDVEARRKVDHSTAGAFHASLRCGSACHPIAFAIAGHHAGLSDRVKLMDRFADRGEKRLAAAIAAAPPTSILDATPSEVPKRIVPASNRDAEGFRRAELFTRMIFSALCDADFLDTEHFFDEGKAALRGGHRPLGELAARLTRTVDGLTKADTEVNRVRAEIRAACVAAVPRERGIFTLTVPTGGGKTLAAMEFGLLHALHHGLRRVVVAIPYTSILEQSAGVYRKAFGLDREDLSVLEHHSAFEPQSERETARSRVASENWDPPVVVTTNVQLLESLFARRPSACRKLHNLARSVIILDEAQTLPVGLLAPTTDVLDALVRDYGCTIILCTATQPTLTRDVLRDCGFTRTHEVIPDPDALARRLLRVDVDWSAARGETSWPELAEKVAAEPDVLAIVHRRDDARDLCAAVDARMGDRSTIHLSALMLPDHRRGVLDDIYARKGRREPVRVISTQLVEAGVDLDFAVVYRALAGLDSLTQAAGRCNREGRLAGRGALRVFRAPTAPPKGILERGLQIAETMLHGGDLDLFSPAVHAEYFTRLYRAGGKDLHDVKAIQDARAALSFERVADSYHIIEDDWSKPLVVVRKHDERARAALDELERWGPSRDRLRRIARITINVNRNDLDQWLRAGAARSICDGMVNVLVGDSAYDDRFGLCPERVGTLAPADSVV